LQYFFCLHFVVVDVETNSKFSILCTVTLQQDFIVRNYIYCKKLLKFYMLLRSSSTGILVK